MPSRALILPINLSIALMLGVPRLAWCDWPPGGVPLCTAGVCSARGVRVSPDGFGGAFVAWQDSRTGGEDIYVQRILTSGEIAPGWPPGGREVCTQTAPQFLTWTEPDALGGVLIVWDDHRNSNPYGGTTGVDIYAQRILADGSIAPGWPVNGAPVTRMTGDQRSPGLVADGFGGAFFTWNDQTGRDTFVQHLDAAGQPTPGWPANGLPICTLPSLQAGFRVIRDAGNGVITVWADLRDGPVAAYAERLGADGTLAQGWPANGVRIVLNQYLRDLVPDGAGGAYVASATTATGQDANYYLQRFTGAGAIVPGWPADGATVCIQPRARGGLRMVPDGQGGTLITWSDYRFDDTGCADDIFFHRFRPDGTRAPGFPVDGLRVTSTCGFDSQPGVAADGLGGAYLCWVRQITEPRIAVQRITGAGTVAAGWPADGLEVPGAGDDPAITQDGMGGAIVAWEASDGSGTVRAVRLGITGPVAVQVSLVSAEAEPEVVRLVWFAAEGASLLATIERRSEGGEWQTLARLSADGTGRLAYEDRAVSPGMRYGYRLMYEEVGVSRTTAETWVTVPAHVLSLQGLTPNPSFGEPAVTFSLARSEPATLEMYDLGGRRVLSRQVGALGPGAHRVELAHGAQLPAGVYHLRLTQGTQQVTRRAIVVR